jgi:hypothetical protein
VILSVVPPASPAMGGKKCLDSGIHAKWCEARTTGTKERGLSRFEVEARMGVTTLDDLKAMTAHEAQEARETRNGRSNW